MAVEIGGAVTGDTDERPIVTEMSDRDGPLVVRWTAPVWWGEPFNEYGEDVCYAIRTPEGVILIDPAVPPRPALAELESFWGELPVATLLTSAWHERDAYVFRQLYGTPVWASRAGAGQNAGAPDHFFDDGDSLLGGLRAVQIAKSFAGEAAFLLDAADEGRALFTGDAIEGPIPDTDWQVSLQLYGNPAPEIFRDRFRRVLNESFTVVFDGHGRPLRDDPHSAIADLLAGGELAYTDEPAAQMPTRRSSTAG
jgi:glyoxylase-like metal-dependent hydrolase (beta-lactamase superfamily II)